MCVGLFVKLFRQVIGKPLFRQFMPVAVAIGMTAGIGTFVNATTPVGSLFLALWIVLCIDIAHVKIRVFVVGEVAQEKRFLAIRHHHKGVCLKSVHRFLPCRGGRQGRPAPFHPSL